MINIALPQQQQAFKNSFSFWCHVIEDPTTIKKNQKSSDYEVNLSKIGTFNDIDSFWEVYQHLKKPGDIDCCLEYQLFKEDIKPVWEEEKNKNGGKFSFLLEKNLSSLVWEDMVIAFCGGVIPFYDEINGITISMRKTYDVAQIWFKEFSKEKCNEMRSAFRSFFSIPSMVNIKMKTFTKVSFRLDKFGGDYSQEYDLVEV